MLNILAAVVLIAGSVQTVRVLSDEDTLAAQAPTPAVVTVQAAGAGEQGQQPHGE